MTNKILDLLYPPRCYVCDRVLPYGDRGVCGVCKEAGLPGRLRKPLCSWCGKPIENARADCCYDCKSSGHTFTAGRAVFAYRGMEDAMNRFKNENRRCYTDLFALERAGVLREYLHKWKPDVIVPIPIHPGKRRRRGYNQAELLSRHLSELTGIPENHKGLVRKKYTLAQKELDDRQRKNNLKDAFRVTEPELFSECTVLLADDIYTTGSTMDAAAACLRDAGARDVYCITVCIGKGY